MSRDRRAESTDLIECVDGKRRRREDWLAVEEPLEIVLQQGNRQEVFLTTMRTPGHDAELAAGLLFAEGVVSSPADIVRIAHSEDPTLPRERRENRVVAALSESVAHAFGGEFRRYASSACGVCGRQTIEDLRGGADPLEAGWSAAPDFLTRLPDALRKAQSVFQRTGGLHAFALFDLSGRMLALREDIGRHNAVDKAVGRMWLDGAVPLSRCVGLTSGRAGFEIAQKSVRAGLPLLASVGAPSTLAVDVALECGLTLVGFLRGGRFNIYSSPERISADSSNSIPSGAAIS